MLVVEGLDALRTVPPGGVMSIGNFDGVHRGHQRILATARDLRATTGGSLTVATFEPHPLTVLKPEHAPPRLTSAAMKREMLAAQGVDRLVVLPPTREVLNTTAEEFWSILRDGARPHHLVEGPNFNFGKGRGGNIDRLREWAPAANIQLHLIDAVEIPLLDLTIAPISSSLIRWLIANGRVRDAAIGLGRAYALDGQVVEGYRRGRTIGIPTANLACGDQLVPCEGVYAGRCAIDGTTYLAAVSIGRAETFGADLRHQLEAHLLDFHGDLYGRTIRLDLLDWIRGQRKYAGVPALLAQIARDIEAIRACAATDPACPIAFQGA